MMRSPRCFTVAVRRRAGQLVIREQPWKSSLSQGVTKVPFLRGALTLFESMQNGYSALKFSADQMEKDLAAEERAEQERIEKEASKDPDELDNSNQKQNTASDTKNTPNSTEKSNEIDTEAQPEQETNSNNSSTASGVGTRLATIVALGLFIALPQVLAWLVGKAIGPGLGFQDFGFHALTGLFKLTLILGYLLLIRRIPDVRRVFQYHGAEHKAIAAYESGQELTVENAKQHSTRHARCGTTFLIVVVMVSVLVYAAILPPLLRGFEGGSAHLVAIGIKILMLPLIAGIAYELQRIGARFSSNPVAKILLTPGYWVQGITTIEPTDDQLEVALASLRVTLKREAQPLKTTKVRSFPSYSALSEAYALD